MEGYGDLCGLPAGLGAFEHPHDVGFLHDEEFFAIDLHFCARPFAEQHPIPWFEIDRKELAGFVTAARANGDDLAFLRLFFRGVRNDNSALRFLFGRTSNKVSVRRRAAIAPEVRRSALCHEGRAVGRSNNGAALSGFRKNGVSD